ncbi:hypothetical protein FS749_004090 [Ceratobasidium sp. UAMH 11750]|nr:hypothetical protein FS749_004090 [Ceratobasidium sp. UAMH 11750]
MQKISQLAAEAPQDKLARDIDVSTIESALLLARTPATIRHLANPPVISGCIQLMKTTAHDAPPFSHKYGYLCFKLLVGALNVCMLEQWRIAKGALTLCDEFPNAAANIPFWMTLARVVDSQFDILKAGGNCDWVLGWSGSTRHPRQTLLLLQSDISTLLSLLWDDQKYLLRALMSYTSSSSGLSGLLFLLSRFVSRERCD